MVRVTLVVASLVLFTTFLAKGAVAQAQTVKGVMVSHYQIASQN